MAAAGQSRADFLGDDLPRTARKSEEADQTRQLLALTVIRDGVLRFKAGGAEALVTRKAPAKTPILTDEHRTALAATVEAGPKPDMDGIGRWRRVDLAQGAQEEPGVPVSRQTPGRNLRAMGFALGFAKLSARPQRRTARRGQRGVQQNVCDVDDHIRSQWGGKPIELRVQDDARMGQKNKRTRRRARRGTRPRAPHDQRTEGACLFGALCPAKGAGRVMPWCDTRPMAEPLKLIGQQGEAGAHALLILDRAGGQPSPKWAVPDNITLVPRPPRAAEVNPVENVWPFIRDTWLSTLVFKTCDDIAAHGCQAWNTLRHQPGRVISIGGREGDHRVCSLSDGIRSVFAANRFLNLVMSPQARSSQDFQLFINGLHRNWMARSARFRLQVLWTKRPGRHSTGSSWRSVMENWRV